MKATWDENGASVELPLTLGTVQLGMPYGIANRTGQPDEGHASRILDAAVKGGISSFDTANKYGSAEKVLGDYFHDKKKPLIISKLYLTKENCTTLSELEELIESGVNTSQEQLRIDRVPGMMLHSPDILEKFGGKATELLLNQVKRGNLGKIGVSIMDFEVKGFNEIWKELQKDCFEIVQLPVNVMDQRMFASGAYERLKDSGKLLFARSIFLQGLFFLAPSDLPESLKEAGPWIERLRAFAESESMSVAQLAFSYIHHMPGIFSIVFGAETPEQVKDNVALLDTHELSESTVRGLKQTFASVPDYIITPLLWNRR
ncbi:aldo/keto reductase [Paenibacillus psychroresistens]|uniref:aldo/keto reductase n=1 Tax=Paenibacillus psychroresistens TaxID=1778678 RepID=UPI001391FCAF|nr:aldo/keto reductase [Paenibacillus psychroresistens]